MATAAMKKIVQLLTVLEERYHDEDDDEVNIKDVDDDDDQPSV